MQPHFKNIFSNRLLQSLLFGAFITFIVSMVWDIPIERFEIKFSGDINKSTELEKLWFFEDFDNDGNTDRIRCFKNSAGGRFTIVGYNHLNQIVSTLHFENDFWTKRLTPAIADVNNDGVKEFIFFSLRSDSIFFTVVDVVQEKILIDHLFFMQVERFSEKMAIHSEFYTESLSMPEYKNELLFHFDAGYGLYPRGLFKINLQSLRFTIPEKSYSPFKLVQFSDLNNDGKHEILTHSYSPSNVAFETNYPDSKSYIAVFNSNLEFIFPPIPVNNEYSSLTSCMDSNSDTLFYIRSNSRSNSSIENQIAVVSISGKIINRKNLPSYNYEINGTRLEMFNNNPYLFINNNGWFRLTPDLKHIPVDEMQNPQGNLHHLVSIKDLNNDGFDEVISRIPGQGMWIYNSRYNHITSTELPVPVNFPPEIVPYMKDGELQNHLFLTGPAYFFFNYSKNPWYYMVYLVFLSLFIFFSGIIYLLLYLQQKRLEKRWDIEKQLSELQFNSVKNQLHPHFMFNALNSVAYMINTGHRQEAYDFLTVNSRMIQQVMDDAREVKRTLNAEINFTKDYLIVQQHRYKERFSTEFNIKPEVDLTIQVPKMCIHTYVENAVKHGFRNTKSGGLLRVDVSVAESGILITITDNGMGLKEASEYNDSTGHGLTVMNEFYRLFEKYHGYNINVKIKDLNPVHNNHTGTQVELKLLHKEMFTKPSRLFKP